MFCNNCGMENPDGSLFCNKCGTKIEIPIAIEEPKPLIAPLPQLKNYMNPFMIFMLIILGIALIILVVMLVSFGLPKKEVGSKNTDNLGTMALVQCRNYVRDSLKSPLTAKFPITSEAESLGNNTYLLQTFVDAENSFGVRIRNDVYCKIQYLGGDEAYQSNWMIIELNLSD